MLITTLIGQDCRPVYNTASQNMRGFGGFLTILIIFKLYNDRLERWAKFQHKKKPKTVIGNLKKSSDTKRYKL